MKHLKTLSVVTFIIISFTYFEYSKDKEAKREQEIKALNNASIEKTPQKNIVTSKDLNSIKGKN